MGFDKIDFGFSCFHTYRHRHEIGLFIAKIVKRLYRSPVLKRRFPARADRIRHILTRQVYGLAPTRIIHLIATHYILGFPGAPADASAHFREADASSAARTSTLPALLYSLFPDS